VLVQEDDFGVLRPVAYYSRSLTERERKYSATMLECTALHNTILHWKSYLRNGLQFEAIVDHYALVYMVCKMGSIQQNQTLTRLCLDLQGFDFKVTHLSGYKHIAADAVSRLFRYEDEPYIYSEEELRDDFGPLTDDQKKHIRHEWPQDAETIIEIILEKQREREQQKAENSEDIAEVLREQTAQSFKDLDNPNILPQLEEEENEIDEEIKIESASVRQATKSLYEKDVRAVRDQYFTYKNLTNLKEKRCLQKQHDQKCHAEKMSKLSRIGRLKSDVNEIIRRQNVIYDRWLLNQDVVGNLDDEETQQYFDATKKYGMFKRFSGIPEFQTASLVYALCDEYISDEIKDLIKVELDKREERKRSPNLCEMSTNNLREKLKRLEGDEHFTERCNIEYELRRRVLGKLNSDAKHELQLIDAVIDSDYELYCQKIKEFQNKYPRIVQVLSDLTLSDNSQSGEKEEVEVNEVVDDELAEDHSDVDSCDSESNLIYKPHELLLRSQMVNNTFCFESEQCESLLLHADKITALEVQQKKQKLRKSDLQLSEQQQKELTEKAAAKRKKQNELKRLQTEAKNLEKQKRSLASKASRAKASIQSINDEQQEVRKRKGRSTSTAVRQSEDEVLTEVIEKKLVNHYNCLISRTYTDPEDNQLYLIYDVKFDENSPKKSPRFVSMAFPINDRGEITSESDIKVLDVRGEKGAMALVNEFQMGKRNTGDIEMPTSNLEWMSLQKADPLLGNLIDKLNAVEHGVITLDGKSALESKDYLFLGWSSEVNALGEPETSDENSRPLMRKFYQTSNLNQNGMEISITREYVQMVVPERLKFQVMFLLHEGMGHPGRNRTINTIRMQYYWPHMLTDIESYTRSCHYCKLRKAHNAVAKVPIMIYDYSDRPFARMHMDLAGPFPTSAKGFKYIMVMKCALTKWVYLMPLKDKTMDEVQLNYWNQFISMHGAPEMCITDCGSEFKNVMSKNIAELLGARKVFTTPRNPRSDGQVENQMRTIKDMLQSFTHENQKDWSDHLHLVQQAYNSTCNDATGFSPHFLLFGKEMNNPSEEHIEQVNALSADEYHAIVNRKAQIMQWCWVNIGKRVRSNSEKFNRIPSERLEFKPYKVGDFFYMKVIPKTTYKTKSEKEAIQISSKLQFRYVGPYRVKKVLLPILYQAEIHGVTKVVHAVNMKPASRDVRKEIYG